MQIMKKTMDLERLPLAIAAIILASCELVPQFQYDRRSLYNNSFIYYQDIGSRDDALKCITNSLNCCNDSDVAKWRDERGGPADEGPNNGAACLYTTQGHGEISLNRKTGCTYHTPGL